jgi:hypothetical protein
MTIRIKHVSEKEMDKIFAEVDARLRAEKTDGRPVGKNDCKVYSLQAHRGARRS